MAANRQPNRPPSLRDAAWLTSSVTRSVLAALTAQGHGARVVGGAVRNAVLGVPVKDVDIATTARPEEVMALAQAANLKAIPTGFDHGTVTLIADHTPFEVTTLRRDVETDGRHARVAYTNDWAEDASRRDFTINALYCDAGGDVHDPVGGWQDIVARRVRFIGRSEARIREDYLRILRFFRFTATYADGAPDADGLAACVALQSGLDTLSAERVRAELLRLLAARRGPEIATLMTSCGILERLLKRTIAPAALERLAAIEAALGNNPDPLLRLAALAVQRPGDALALRDTLRLSAKEYERLARLSLPDRAHDPARSTDEDMTQVRAFIYRHGRDAFADGALLAWARGADPCDDRLRHERLSAALAWPVPELPVAGADVVALGLKPGPGVGRVLSSFEDWWIAAGFPLDAARGAAELQRLVNLNRT